MVSRAYVPDSGDLRVDRARLRALLSARKADLSVRAMVWRAQEDAEAAGRSPISLPREDVSDEDYEGEDEGGAESMELDELWQK